MEKRRNWLAALESCLLQNGIVYKIIEPDLHFGEKSILIEVVNQNHSSILKIYSKKDVQLFEHEHKILSSLSKYLYQKHFYIPLIVPLESNIESAINEFKNLQEDDYYIINMTRIDGNLLSNSSYSTFKSLEIMCKIVEGLISTTIEMSSIKKNEGRLIHCQGIYSWVESDHSKIPYVTIDNHFDEIELLVSKQSVLSKKKVFDLINRFHHLKQINSKLSYLAHNDIHIGNIIVYNQKVGLIDFACSYKTSLLADFGGVLAHVGNNYKDYIVYRASTFLHSLNIEPGYLIDQISFYSIKRALRRILFLEEANCNRNSALWDIPISILTDNISC
ncbi:MAG: phosphotransferase [Flavipsychrobacter sp.]